jgi:simple sugar transport system permease protein
VFFAVAVVAALVATFTPFGRNVYAIGGDEHSAILMGLPVGRTKIAIYTLSGFCSALAGVVFSIYKLSGYANDAVGMELDAIAAVVIGGTLLTGGVGTIAGTVVGVLILAIIGQALIFQGNVSSWWARIIVGALLLIFIVLQKLLTRQTDAAAD